MCLCAIRSRAMRSAKRSGAGRLLINHHQPVDGAFACNTESCQPPLMAACQRPSFLFLPSFAQVQAHVFILFRVECCCVNVGGNADLFGRKCNFFHDWKDLNLWCFAQLIHVKTKHLFCLTFDELFLHLMAVNQLTFNF